MATHARQQYFADENSLSKERREFSIADEIQEKIDSVEEGAQVNKIETVKVNGTALVPDIAKAVNVEVPDVIDNLYTVAADDALSAKQGKILYDYIQNLQTIGRFLSNWDSATGLPITNPSESPYLYKAGDYYRVSNVAVSPATNYKPDGSSYTIGVASTTVETLSVAVSDLYLYDGTDWILLSNSGSAIAIDSSLSTTSTNPVENRVITNALNGKHPGAISNVAPSSPVEGMLRYDTTNDELKTYNGTAWQNATGGADIVYATQAEYNALLPGALTDNKHYFIYTKSGGPIPSVISCDFTQSDEGFTFDNPPTIYGRDSNGFYIKSDYSWGTLGALIIPQTIIDTGTPTMIKLYAKNMDSGAGAGIYKAVGDEFARYFNGELNMSPSRGTPHTLLTGTAEDVFVLDFDNEICYLESAPGTTATIYSSTILNDWSNGINLCIMSPNSGTYGYLTKAEFYF